MNGKLHIVGCRAHTTFADTLCHTLVVERTASKVVTFGNENMEVQVGENVRGADVFVVSTSCPPVHTNLWELMLTINALKFASADRITVVLPYLPYVRSDKKDKPRISMGAKLVAQQLKTAGADRILTMDLHADQIGCFFDFPVDQLRARPVILRHLRETFDLSNTVLVAGDAGSAKMAGGHATPLKLQMAIVDKRREGDDDKAKPTHLVGDVKGKDCIFIDDEAASARTLVEGATFLIEHGAASVSAAVTHPVLTDGAVERIQDSPLRQFIFTDTVPTPLGLGPKFVRLSTVPMFAAAIDNIHQGASVSVLLQG